MYIPFIVPGGMIAFHDIVDGAGVPHPTGCDCYRQVYPSNLERVRNCG